MSSSKAAVEQSDVAPEPESAVVHAPTAARRLDCIDFLRGVACFWVLIHHTFARGVIPIDKPMLFRCLVALANIGWLGVSLFLTLSGFCLYYPIAARQGVEQGRVDIKPFAVRRCRRILPPYLVSLAIFAGMGYMSARVNHFWEACEFVSWRDVAAHVFMIHNLRSSTYASINASYWSLALEFQLYIVFPLLVALASKRGLLTIGAVTLILSSVWQYQAYRHWGPSFDWIPQRLVSYDALPGRCFEFVAGMIAAALVARPKPGYTQAAALMCGVLVLPALWVVLFVSHYGPLYDQAWGILFAGAIVLLARVPNTRFERHKLLKAFVWLGTVSYSVYLVHQPLLRLLIPHKVNLHIAGSAAETVFAIICIFVVIAIGFGFHTLFEKPFMAKPKQRAEGSLAPSPIESKTIHVI